MDLPDDELRGFVFEVDVRVFDGFDVLVRGFVGLAELVRGFAVEPRPPVPPCREQVPVAVWLNEYVPSAQRTRDPALLAGPDGRWTQLPAAFS